MSGGMVRREFLEWMGSACLSCMSRSVVPRPAETSKADATLHISPVEIEIAPGKIIKTTGYNGSAPGPFLRFREGQQVTVDVFNDTKDPELVHWHGLFLPSEVDGSAEEGTPLIPPGSSQRYSFVARPSGTRWYHTHVPAGRDLKRATYTGQFGMVYIEPPREPGEYDAEHSLCLHGWQPYLSAAGGEGSLEAVYQSFSVNDRALGHGERGREDRGNR